jgi:hypothetical protein
MRASCCPVAKVTVTVDALHEVLTDTLNVEQTIRREETYQFVSVGGRHEASQRIKSEPLLKRVGL